MDQQKVITQIQLNLKEIYHRSIDADQKLKEFKSEGLAQFDALFSNEQLFKQHHTSFLPYVEELASDLVLLQEATDEDHFVSQLKLLMTKLEAMNLLLVSFKQKL